MWIFIASNVFFIMNSFKHLMPQKFESSILDLDKIPEDECKRFPLNCPWTISFKDESLTVIITCSKWTFSYDFCVRVTALPQGAPGVSNVSKQIDLDDHHRLLRCLTDALNLYKAFPEPHLNTHQLDIVEVLLGYLNLKFYWNTMAYTHFAYPALARDKISGTDPD